MDSHSLENSREEKSKKAKVIVLTHPNSLKTAKKLWQSSRMKTASPLIFYSILIFLLSYYLIFLISAYAVVLTRYFGETFHRNEVNTLNLQLDGCPTKEASKLTSVRLSFLKKIRPILEGCSRFNNAVLRKVTRT